MTRSASYTPQIVIGIVAPEQLIPSIKEALRGFPNIESHYFLAPSTIDEPLLQFIGQHELTLIADPFLYHALKQQDAALHLYQFNSYAHQLYQLVLQKQLKQVTPKLSFDFMQKSDVLAIAHQLHYPIDFVVVQPDALEQMVQAHKANAALGYTVVTTVPAIFDALQADNIAVYYLQPSRLEMIVALERLLLASKSRQNKESQIVLGIIELDHVTATTATKVQQILQQFVQQMDGYLIEINLHAYHFIATRGQFERETLGYKHLPILHRFNEELHIQCVVGIGFGAYPNDAGMHAEKALYQARETGKNVCYIVREDARAIGPIDTTVFLNYEQYPLTITDLELLERAEKAGMSATYISKLMARLAKHQKYIYTAEEIASTLNITLRSANRILLKWLDAGLVTIIGEEKLTHRGRPRRIYSISFLENLMS